MNPPNNQFWRYGATFILASVALLAAAAGPTAAQAGCDNADRRTDRLHKTEARRAVKCLINHARSGQNLKDRNSLEDAAQRHTEYMRKTGCFSHQCPGEGSILSRIRQAGYLIGAISFTYNEVIAAGPNEASPRDVVRMWLGSASHRDAILRKSFEHLGVGVSARNGRSLYTVVLGARSG